jgi:hypothetical protein
VNFSKLIRQPWFYPLFLLLVMGVSYSLYLFWLGFYWDDWLATYLNGSSVRMYWDFYYYDRPFSIWTYLVTSPILGTRPILWHLFTLLVRWSGVLAFCWGLKGLWPERAWQVEWMGLLLGIFPGFKQQLIPVAYSQHFITFGLFLLSIALMIWSLRKRRLYKIFMPLAVIFAGVELLTMEYFTGLELIRPVILFLILHQGITRVGKTLLKTVVHWAPYLAIYVAFMVWRLVIYPRWMPETGNVAVGLGELAQADTILKLVTATSRDFLQSVLFSWTALLNPETLQFNAKIFYLSTGIGIILAILAAFYFLRVKREIPATEIPSLQWQGIWLGGVAILLGGLPVWGTGRQTGVGMWSDRFYLSLMFGAVIFIVSLVDWFISQRTRKTILLATLLALCIASHVRTANRYRLDWQNQKTYYQQLNWRVPALRPDTAVLGLDIPFSFESRFSLGFALNRIYDPRPASAHLYTWWIPIDPGQPGGGLSDWYAKDVPIRFSDRNVVFESDTSRSIVLVRNFASDCLLVLSPVYQGIPNLVADEGLFIFTNPGQIKTDPELAVRLPESIFGQENRESWCYYFEKADLAMQKGDWAAITYLGDEVGAKGLSPENGAELVPFIVGYGRAGLWEQASQATEQGFTLLDSRFKQSSQPYFCRLWDDLLQNTSDTPDRQQAVQQIQQQLQCKW